MKAKVIATAVAVAAMALILFLMVRLVLGLLGGLDQATQTTEVLTQELMELATPNPEIYTDQYYDEMSDEPEEEPLSTREAEVMVAVPVIETPEDLARDEAA